MYFTDGEFLSDGISFFLISGSCPDSQDPSLRVGGGDEEI